MQLPQSGISRYETFMNSHLPDGIHFSDEEQGYTADQKITAIEVKYYCAQIQLRITLNSIHHGLYHKDAPSEYHPNALLIWAVALIVVQNYSFRCKRV